MTNERPKRYDLPPATPPPSEGRPAQAALPVGVRTGDLLIIGTADYDIGRAEELRASLREELDIDVKVLFISGAVGVTVLRPER